MQRNASTSGHVLRLDENYTSPSPYLRGVAEIGMNVSCVFI